MSFPSFFRFNMDDTATAAGKALSSKELVRLERSLSPDGKYRVQFSDENYSLHNKYGYFAIYDVKSKTGTSLSRVVLRKNIYFMGSKSFVWIPKRSHTLVFCTKLPKGKPYIGLWSGGKSVHILRLGNLPPGVDPDAEYFEITGLSADGRELTYQHYDMTTKEKEPIADQRFKVKHRLQLPPPAQ